MPTVQADQLLGQSAQTIVDARSAERFRGEVEPLDPVAGHIPGARNRFHKDNLGADGRFKPAAELRAAFERPAGEPARVVHQCGSGVTACHNLLAMEHAGLKGSALYPGSWSEWAPTRRGRSHRRLTTCRAVPGLSGTALALTQGKAGASLRHAHWIHRP